MDNQHYVASDFYGNWSEIALDVFVVVKAATLFYVSVTGARWFLKSKLNALVVAAVLLVSATLVIMEMVFRFSNRSLFHRFLLNAFSQWLVFWCLTVMLGSPSRSEAAKYRYPLRRMIFIPLHLLYATSIIMGCLN